MCEFESVFFGHYYENSSAIAFELLEENGPSAAIDYLKQWHYYGEHEVVTYPFGDSDHLFKEGNYILSWNDGLGYISLNYQL